MNFHDNSKNKNLFFIRFSTLRIFHESGIKTEGGGGVHVLSWDRAGSDNSAKVKRPRQKVSDKVCLGANFFP